jgi:hypothetical protein
MLYQKIESPDKHPDIEVVYEISDRFVPFIHTYLKAQVADRHAIGICMEYFRFEQSSVVIDYIGGAYSPSGLIAVVYNSDLTCCPISIFYEYSLKNSDENIIPFAGAGLSFYSCKITNRPDILYTYGNITNFAESTEKGYGWGIYIDFGLRAFINENIYLDSKIKMRHVEPMAFSGRLKDGFGNTGILLGIGWQF